MQQPKPKEINAAFNQLAQALGKPRGQEPGQWFIEFTGGGYRISTKDKNGKLYHPMGANCFSPREFLIALFFATQCLTVHAQSQLTIMGGTPS